MSRSLTVRNPWLAQAYVRTGRRADAERPKSTPPMIFALLSSDAA